MEVIIRPATIEDLDGIERIYDEIHAAEADGRMQIGWLPGVYPVRKTAEDSLARGDMFVLEADGVLAASAILNKLQVDCYREGHWKYKVPEEQVMVMHTLVVDPGMNGQGLAGHFVRYYETFALEQGCHELRIDTQAKNARARRMYAKMGFWEVDIVNCTFNGIPDIHLVLLEKQI